MTTKKYQANRAALHGQRALSELSAQAVFGLSGSLELLPPAPGAAHIWRDRVRVPSPGPGKFRRPPADMLLEFIALGDATPPDVAAFARRFGPLGVCRLHGLPSQHEPECWSEPAYRFPSKRAGFRECAEPIEAWFTWARKFRAVYDAALALKAGGPRMELAYGELLPDTPPQMRGLIAPATWGVLSIVVSSWARNAGLFPRVRPGAHGRPQLELVAQGNCRVFGVLVLQMMAEVVDARGKQKCDGDNCTQMVERARPRGRLVFCKKCGRRMSNRLAKRRARAKPANEIARAAQAEGAKP